MQYWVNEKVRMLFKWVHIFIFSIIKLKDLWSSLTLCGFMKKKICYHVQLSKQVWNDWHTRKMRFTQSLTSRYGWWCDVMMSRYDDEIPVRWLAASTFMICSRFKSGLNTRKRLSRSFDDKDSFLKFLIKFWVDFWYV